MRLWVWPSLLLVACAPRLRHDHLGHGTAVVGAAATATASPGAGAVAITAPGTHRVDWSIHTPRALRVAWTVDCGGAVAAGVAGETFAEYRQRRLAELARGQEQKKAAIAAIGGAVLGGAVAAADVETAHGDGSVEVGVDGTAVGAAVADQVVSDRVALPAGDVGAQVLTGSVTLLGGTAGVCSMRIAPEDPAEDPAGVAGEFAVTRVVDVAAERAVARAAARDAAIATRSEVSVRLVAGGADPDRRARVEGEARHARSLYAAYLVGECGADPEHQARREAARQAELAAKIELRRRRDAERAARIEVSLERHRRALATRAEVVAYLEWLGAVAPPPMPDPIIEDPGEPPVIDAIWVTGEWIWRGGEWVWIGGSWSFPTDRFTVEVHDDDDDEPRPRVIDHRDDTRPRERDHRDDRVRERDHRQERPEPRDEPRPRVRDHREERKDDDDDDDDRPRRRDHRR
jgi:hypothetical protein